MRTRPIEASAPTGPTDPVEHYFTYGPLLRVLALLSAGNVLKVLFCAH